MHADSYTAPLFFRNGHLQTVYATLCRTVAGVTYRRERIDTPDGDFLDLDWSGSGSRRLAVISHGLEGHANRAYVRGMVRTLNAEGIDALAWNFRGCSGAPNRLLRMYHNGATDDLHRVITHALSAGRYDSVFLVGFSMGGNLSLLYLGKEADSVPGAVRGAACFSVPCNLADAARELEKKVNALYMKRFLAMLHTKIKAKQHAFPEALDDSDYHRISTFKQFDDRYTAPIHGFAGAEDYWQQCSCAPWLPRIRVPALIVNALDDPFLAGRCYPAQECRSSARVRLETTRHGGHVGFITLNPQRRYWSEQRTLRFIREL
ncbi:YheT family hydrolase [Thermodesulfobacteriota bacterium]